MNSLANQSIVTYGNGTRWNTLTNSEIMKETCFPLQPRRGAPVQTCAVARSRNLRGAPAKECVAPPFGKSYHLAARLSLECWYDVADGRGANLIVLIVRFIVVCGFVRFIYRRHRPPHRWYHVCCRGWHRARNELQLPQTDLLGRETLLLVRLDRSAAFLGPA